MAWQAGALKFFGEIYDIKLEVQEIEPDERRRMRQERSTKVADALHQWLEQQPKLVTEGSATAKAIDYSLKRWKALTRFIDDGELPADNNGVENQIRPIAIGRSNWLFAGSLRAGQRAAALLSLLQVGPTQRAGPVQLHQRRADPVANAAGGVDQGLAATSLAARRLAQIRLDLAGRVARALTLR